jgi:hypothetical protein
MMRMMVVVVMMMMMLMMTYRERESDGGAGGVRDDDRLDLREGRGGGRLGWKRRRRLHKSDKDAPPSAIDALHSGDIRSEQCHRKLHGNDRNPPPSQSQTPFVVIFLP